MKIRIPSPATAISTVAVLLALTGTATAAGLITGAQIANNTVASTDLRNNDVRSIDIQNNGIRSIDVKDGSLSPVDFKPGAILKGDTGPAGPSGPAGPAGVQGAPGVSGLEIVTVESAVSSDPGRTVDVDCPAGKQLVGGGAQLSGAAATTFIALDESYPASPTKWRAVAYEINDAAGSWKLAAYAICATAGA